MSYTASCGIYVSVIPDAASKELIARLQCFGEHNEPKDELHCTVVWSKDSIEKRIANVAELAAPKIFHAEGVEVTSWSGHDNGGYIVLLLKSADLTKENRKWKALGATSSFPIYKPHITLAHNLDIKKQSGTILKLNHFLSKHPLNIVLQTLSVSDAKQ